MKRKPELAEARTTIVDTGDFRRAISSLVSAAKIGAEALRVGERGDRDRGRSVIEHCTDALAALAFAQIPKEQR